MDKWFFSSWTYANCWSRALDDPLICWQPACIMTVKLKFSHWYKVFHNECTFQNRYKSSVRTIKRSYHVFAKWQFSLMAVLDFLTPSGFLYWRFGGSFSKLHRAPIPSTDCSPRAASSKMVWGPKRFAETSHRSCASAEDQNQKSCGDISGLRDDRGRPMNQLMTLPPSFLVKYCLTHFFRYGSGGAILLHLVINWRVVDGQCCVTLHVTDWL